VVIFSLGAQSIFNYTQKRAKFLACFSFIVHSSIVLKIPEMINVAAADHIRNQRIRDKTKDIYISKINKFKVYLLNTEFADQVLGPENELLLHEASVEDQFNILKSFFGWLSVNTDLADQREKYKQRSSTDVPRLWDIYTPVGA
jgi:hypothetical protein